MKAGGAGKGKVDGRGGGGDERRADRSGGQRGRPAFKLMAG